MIQFDPETSPEIIQYHGPPQVMLAYLKYQWSLGEDHKRREAFARLQVWIEFFISVSRCVNILSDAFSVSRFQHPCFVVTVFSLGSSH